MTDVPTGSVRVTFLGSGDAFSAGGAYQAAYLAETDAAACLLDCGSTALSACKRHGIDPARIDAILLSHLHGDHFAGLPFLFLEYIYETARHRALQVVGPPGTAERVTTLFQTTYRRTASKGLPFALRFAELTPPQAIDVGPFHVEPFLVPHQREEISLGFRVTVAGRTIVYSGDTGWTDDLVHQSAGADLFICECSYFETRVDFHLDYPRLAENRHRFDCKRMILTHLGREVLARRGEVVIETATDGLVVDL